MSSPKFYLWVTARTDVYADLIIVKLVKRGFSVSPLASNGEVALKTELSALISLEVVANGSRTKNKAPDYTKFMDEVLAVLGELKMLYHSVIVSEVGGPSAWKIGNLTLPKRESGSYLI
jgi:hypothetical protein